MKRFKLYCAIAGDKDIFVKSLKIALVVGTLLNFINQGDKLINLNFEDINYFKFILTYFVPFLVSTYTALSIKMKFNLGDVTPVSAHLECKGCGNLMDVEQNTVIPVCANCNEKTKWRIA